MDHDFWASLMPKDLMQQMVLSLTAFEILLCSAFLLWVQGTRFVLWWVKQPLRIRWLARLEHRMLRGHNGP